MASVFDWWCLLWLPVCHLTAIFNTTFLSDWMSACLPEETGLVIRATLSQSQGQRELEAECVTEGSVCVLMNSAAFWVLPSLCSLVANMSTLRDTLWEEGENMSKCVWLSPSLSLALSPSLSVYTHEDPTTVRSPKICVWCYLWYWKSLFTNKVTLRCWMLRTVQIITSPVYIFKCVWGILDALI